jgi:hypothetical protein
LANAERLRR